MGSIRYSYKSFPNCPKATAYSKEREENSALISSFAGIGVLVAFVYFCITTFEFFGEYNWSSFLESILLVAASALLILYLVILRPITTDCELEVILFEEMNKKMSPEDIASHCYKLREVSKIEKRSATNTFVKGFLVALPSVIALIGAIKGVYFICRKQGTMALLVRQRQAGWSLLLYSLGALVVLSLIAFLLFRRGHKKTKNHPQSLLVKESGDKQGIKQTQWTDEDLEKEAQKRGIPVEALKIVLELEKKIGAEQESNQVNQTTPVEAMFCRKCGAKLLPDSAFCSQCGTKVMCID